MLPMLVHLQQIIEQTEFLIISGDDWTTQFNRDAQGHIGSYVSRSGQQ